MLAGVLTIPGAAQGDDPECPPFQYRIIDLHEHLADPDVPGHSLAYGINDRGEVVGDFPGSGQDSGALLWLPRDAYGLTGRTTMDLLNIIGPSTTDVAIARDININGMIVGNWGTISQQITLWDLSTLNDINLSSPQHLDSTGVGRALTDSSPPVIVGRRYEAPYPPDPGGFRYELDVKIELLMPAPIPYFVTGEPFDVSESGVAVGLSTEGAPFTDDPCGPQDLWSTQWLEGPHPNNEAPGDVLTGLADQSHGRFAYGINNDHHHIVGESRDPDENCVRRATIWPFGIVDAAEALPFVDPIDSNDSYANAVSDLIGWTGNSEVHVVGRDEELDAATLWRGNPGDWSAYDLNEISCGDMLPPLQLREATDVNNHGWIVGWMRVNIDDPEEAATHAFLLVPRGWCPGDLNFDGVVDGIDLLMLLASWGNCPDPCCCLADLNDDGAVNGADLLILLSNWGQCPGFAHVDDPLPLEDLLANAGLTTDDWDEFVDVMTGDESDAVKDNYLCWMENHLTQCTTCPTCRGRDPFDD